MDLIQQVNIMDSQNYGMGERRIGYSYVRTKADVNATAVYNTWKKALGE